MKKSYLFNAAGLLFAVGLLFSSLNAGAQNRNYLDFDGNNDYVKYTDDATLERMDGATDYTIEAWIYPVDGIVVEYDRVLQRYYSFNIQMYDGNNDGKVEDWYFVVINGGDHYFNTQGDATLTLNAWNHIAVINNSADGSLKLFVNGVDVTQSGGYSNYSLPASTSGDNLYIGSYKASTPNNSFGGYIDEVRLKNVAETSLHHSRTDNQYTSDDNTAGLFHFNEGTGTTTVNEASSSNATLNNGVVWRSWSYVSGKHLPLAYEWTGGTDTDWGTTGNWDGGTPGASNDVIVPNVTNDPVIGVSTEADCNNLLIESSATLEISSSSSATGSLIIGGSLTNSGNITINRYMTSYTDASDGWRFLSAPVSNFTISGSDFEPTSGDDDLYEYDEAAASQNWINYDGGTFGDTEFEVGKGYLAAYKTAATKQFTGDINTGSFTKNLSVTSGASSPGWNLLGNPYTAAIDWDLLTKTASVDGSVYVLRASDGAYISWNGSSGDLTNGIIPAMQGFFVKATAASQSVTMDAADEVHATSSYYKSGNAEKTVVINVQGEKGESNAYLQFRDDATKEFDHAIDAYKLFGFSLAPQIYTNDGENMYSINCLPAGLKSYTLPLAVKTGVQGQYTLTFTGIEGIADDIEIKLNDLKLNNTVKLAEGDQYTFEYAEDDDINRFELEFLGVTGINQTTASGDRIYIYSSGNNVVIKGLDNNMLNGSVTIFNLLGQTVYSQQLNGGNEQNINTELNTGIYVINLTMDEGYTVSQKVIIR